MTVADNPFGVLLARMERLESTGSRRLEPHQVPPPGDWYGWLLFGGRGSGKTHGICQYAIDHVNGPPCLSGPVPHWIGIIAPTLGDAATSVVKGPSGLQTLDPSCRMVQADGGTVVRWPNGSEAKLFGTKSPDDIERLRSGGNRCLFLLEEVAAWRHLDDAWDHMRFGLRVGPRPHWVGATTPKPRLLIKRLAAGEVADVMLTRGTMWQNPHLPPHIREALEESYGGRRLGRQELHGEIIDEDENALFTRVMLDDHRVMPEGVPPLERITVGVDPSGGAGEQGIVPFGRWTRLEAGAAPTPRKRVSDGYVLGDYSCHLSPEGWGRRAVQCAVDFEADDIVVETNFGGDMALATIRGAAEAVGVHIPVRKITASRGKRARAEPVAAMAERGRLHVVGNLAELETQMCTWTDDLDWSPDRMDAMVWGPWHLRLVSTLTTGGGSFGGSAMAAARVIGGRS